MRVNDAGNHDNEIWHFRTRKILQTTFNVYIRGHGWNCKVLSGPCINLWRWTLNVTLIYILKHWVRICKGGQVAYLKSTPGLTELFSGPSLFGSSCFENFERQSCWKICGLCLWVVPEVWACSYQYGAWSTKICGSINTAVGPVSAHSIKDLHQSIKLFCRWRQ